MQESSSAHPAERRIQLLFVSTRMGQSIGVFFHYDNTCIGTVQRLEGLLLPNNSFLS